MNGDRDIKEKIQNQSIYEAEVTGLGENSKILIRSFIDMGREQPGCRWDRQ